MKIKSFVGLNGSGDSYNLAEDKLPNENDEVYFTLVNPPYDEYYKGTYQENSFYSKGISYPIKDVENWCLVSDPTAIQRLIFYFDLGFYFDAADWERWNKDGVIYDTYPNGPARVDIEDLGLTKQTETLLREYIEFAESYDSFSCEDPVALHNIDQMGLFVYEELRQELADKCYLIYCPISGGNNTPGLIDNNEGNFSFSLTTEGLPLENKEVYFQLDSITGEFKAGYYARNINSNKGAFYFFDNKITSFPVNKVYRWQYTNKLIWVDISNKLPEVNKKLHFHIKDVKGLLSTGELIQTDSKLIFLDEQSNYFELNKVSSWAYTND